MKLIRQCIPALLLLALPAISLAQASPAQPARGPSAPSVPDADIPGILRQLENTATRQPATDRLMGISSKQLVPLYESLDGNTASAELKKQLLDLLPKIHGVLNQRHREAESRKGEQDLQNRINEYLKVGQHDPKWDNLVVDAFKGLANNPTSPTKFKAALDAGCTDPYVRYYYFSRISTNDPQEVVAGLDRAAADGEKSAYPASRKFFMNIRFAVKALPQPNSSLLQPRIDEAVAHAADEFPALVESAPEDAILLEATKSLYSAEIYRDKGKLKMAFDKIDPALQQFAPANAITFYFEAQFYTDWAWDARGDGYADTVTAEGAKLFHDRITLAEPLAKKGWSLDPTVDGCATSMITICMAKASPRPEMEKWFRRAMIANPNSFNACDKKFNYLLPQWYGSFEEMISFGRECLKISTPQNRLALFLIRAHAAVLGIPAGNQKKFPDPDDLERYYARPEVWNDIQSAYDKLLSDKSRLQSDRTVYLKDRADYFQLAYDVKNWKAVANLAEDFGNDIDQKSLHGIYPEMINTARQALGLVRAPAIAAISELPMVSLHVKNATLDKIAESLRVRLKAEELGVAPSGSSNAATFSLDVDEVTLWQAIVKLEAQHPFNLAQPPQPKRGILFADAGKPIMATQVSGDVLMILNSPVKGSALGPAVPMTVVVDPRLNVLELQMNFGKAMDNRKQSLSNTSMVALNRNLYAGALNLNPLPADAGDKFSFDVQVKYSSQETAFSAAINDVQSHLNEPFTYGSRTFTVAGVDVANNYVTIQFNSEFATVPRGIDTYDSTGHLLDASGKELATMRVGNIKGDHFRASLAGSKGGPYKLIVDYPDSIKKQTANFSFNALPLNVDSTSSTRP